MPKQKTSSANQRRWTNKEIAALFFRIADILEIQGEIVFKVVAYRRAADAIEHLGQVGCVNEFSEQLVEQFERRRSCPQLLGLSCPLREPLMRKRKSDVIGNPPGNRDIRPNIARGCS